MPYFNPLMPFESEDETVTEPLAQSETGSLQQSSPATTKSGSSSFDACSDSKERTHFCDVVGCAMSHAKNGLKDFVKKQQLDRHRQSTHGAPRPFKCEGHTGTDGQPCPSAFKCKQKLKRHLNQVHSEVRPFKRKSGDLPSTSHHEPKKQRKELEAGESASSSKESGISPG